MEPDLAGDPRRSRHDKSLPRVGNAGTSVGAARRAGQRHAHPKLRARRRASPGRAARRRGYFAAAAGNYGNSPRSQRARFPARGGRRLRDRAARRQMHGPAAYRAGLAFRRDRRGIFRRVGRGGGVAAHRRPGRARARHRRHASGRADGRAIRRHGQAHARRARGAERALRRAAGGGRVHRHHRCFRISLWRLLHDVLALDRSLQSRRAVVGARPAVGDDAHLAEVLFLRRQQPHHARRHPHDAGPDAVRRRTISPRSWCTVRM